MLKVRSLLLFISIVFSFLPAQAMKNEVSSYVDNILNKFVAIASNPSFHDEVKVSKAKVLIFENLDVDWMAKFVLGRYRRGLPAEEIRKFTETYKDYVTSIYAAAVKQYKGQEVQVTNIKNIADNEYAVKTSIMRDGQDPLVIDYMVRVYPGDVYKVFDVVTEGVSLITSQQAEFTNTISHSSLEQLRQGLVNKMK